MAGVWALDKQDKKKDNLFAQALFYSAGSTMITSLQWRQPALRATTESNTKRQVSQIFEVRENIASRFFQKLSQF